MRDYIDEHREELFMILLSLMMFILGFISGYIKHIEVSKETDYKTNDNCTEIDNKYYCEVIKNEK